MIKKTVKNYIELLNACISIRGKMEEEKTYIFEFKEQKNIRSLSQNKLLHVWIGKFCDFINIHDTIFIENTKEELRQLFAPKIYSDGLIKGFERSKKTSEMSKIEFSKFLEDVRDFFFAEYSLLLPWPDDGHFDEIIKAKE